MIPNVDMIKVALWPDGTWCDADEVHKYMSWMSDDYQIIYVTEEAYENQTFLR